MKKRILPLLLIFLCSLSGCETDEKDYKTPELFVAQLSKWECSRHYWSSLYDLDIDDCDGIVLEELKKINKYEETDKVDNPSDRYVIYENWVPATSGPNIARMTIYIDGYLEIYRKESLGWGHYFYYSIDESLAVYLNEYIEELVKEANSNSDSLWAFPSF